MVRGLVLASSAPQGAAGMHGWAPEVIKAVGAPAPNRDGCLSVFFTRSTASRQSGVETLGRMAARSEDRDKATSWQTRQAQYDAVCAWGIPDHGLLQRVSAIEMPVFVANGDSDPMSLLRYSYLLAGLIPGARLKISPDSAHGFLFQYHAEFAADVDAFLAVDEPAPRLDRGRLPMTVEGQPTPAATGAELEIRPIQPGDKAGLASAVEKSSDELSTAGS